MSDIEMPKLGMSEKQILDLCSDNNNHPIFRGAPYWTAEIYSLGKHIRKYAFYPKLLPLAIYTDHGPGQIVDHPFKHELETDAPTMFYHSIESVKIWKKFSNKPCYTIYSPFVYYRRKNNIKKIEGAKGTIAFPTHSTADIDDLSDMKKYIDDLKSLPEKFQPVSVCLHITDIKKGHYNIFMENGIPVFTVGGNNGKFAERFYNIIKNFSYVTSNLVGSSLYYAVEMGTPFFIYGDKPLFFNKGDVNMPSGEYDFYDGHKHYQNVHRTFSGLDCEMTDEKIKIVEHDLGLDAGLSRGHMSAILYLSLIKWIFSLASLRWIRRSISRIKK